MEVIFHQDNQTLEFRWSKETVELTNEDFKRELVQQVKSVEESTPQNVLIDTTQFIFPISPEIQNWVDEAVYPAWAAAGLTKMGFLMSPEMVSQLSIQQAVAENSQVQLKSGFFETKEQAFEWFGA